MNRRKLMPAFLFILILVSFSCKKNSNDSPEWLLENNSWQPALADEHTRPGTYGEFILFSPWLECDLDDQLTFKDGKFFVDLNATCDIDKSIFTKYNNAKYFYDPLKKQLIIGDGNDGLSFTVFEVSEKRLVIGRPIAAVPALGGVIPYNYLGYLFLKK
ncbi:hypothetical protein [Pseudoflavitalea rhizosphaerae]|uniref:hypothetical protein n=1 Tax=Pseudoflavitalea rhizosphaerae TaxID=1884793 RepID=UPI000F8E3333|nr:hypothetical protein [Pseudoflavitalea rhizosphaerae]